MCLKILEHERGAPRVPPASKEVVANLPVISINEEILGKLGKEAECAICKENLVVNDKMQELPCKHTFHPPCLKPWLVSISMRIVGVVHICFMVHLLYCFFCLR